MTPYHTASGEVMLHTWTESAGQKTANDSILGVPGTIVPSEFRAGLSQKALPDIAIFPSCPADETR